MAWNEGLRTWMERRDAWAGARTRREIRARGEEMKRGSGSGSGAGATDGGIQEEATNDESTELAAKAMTSLAIAGKDGKVDGKDPGDEQDRDDKPTEPTNLTESEQLPEESNHHHHHDYSLEEDEQDLSDIPDEPYIPVVPSILAHTNPIRASITPSMYPSIYSKVIVQSLTPTVPINLADVTKAMVQGWKADGTWPAKPPATSIVLPDTATIPKKDRDDDHHNRRKSGARGGGSSGSPENKRKSGVASAVRKVLHFSGFHPHHHPFHRRGSSHGGGHYNTHEDAGPSNLGHGHGHSER